MACGEQAQVLSCRTFENSPFNVFDSAQVGLTILSVEFASVGLQPNSPCLFLLLAADFLKPGGKK